MMRMPDIEVEIYQWLGRIPWLLVACAGIVLCMLLAGKHPRRCLLIGSALVIELAVSAAGPFLVPLLFASFNAGNMNELKWRILLNGLVYSIPNAVALALLLWAAFAPMWPSRAPGTASE